MDGGRTDERRLLEETQRENEELRASRARVARAADADRRDLERALHRGVQQDLVGIAANLEIVAGALDADPTAAKATLDELRREVTRALTELQELAARIFPPLLEGGGLVPELRAAAARARSPIRIDASATSGLPPEVAAAIYFCVLDVVELSPAATPIVVSVREDGEEVAFEIVADAELGTEPRAAHDRVEALGGHVAITAADDRTTVTGSLPDPR